MNRRHFLQQSALLASISTTPSAFRMPTFAASRQFTMSLDPGAIGVEVGQYRLIDLAAKYRFEAVAPYPSFLATLDSSALNEVQDSLREKQLAWGVAGLPVEFRKDSATFQEDIKKLPPVVKALQQAGGTRMSTWVMPNHAELTYLKNFQLHKDRLLEIGKVLNDHGVRFGLEYVGTKTLRDSKRFAFISSMEEARTLIEEIGLPNLGLVLDSFHWYTAEESVDDILTLTNQEVVAAI